jgi:hypothetical protein
VIGVKIVKGWASSEMCGIKQFSIGGAGNVITARMGEISNPRTSVADWSDLGSFIGFLTGRPGRFAFRSLGIWSLHTRLMQITPQILLA